VLAVGLAGLVLFATSALTGPTALAAPGSLLAGLAGAWSLRRCQRLGFLRTRWGLVRRDEQPALFRFHVGCGWVAVVLWMLVGLLVGFGVLPTSPR
jgi:hypothetical protein